MAVKPLKPKALYRTSPVAALAFRSTDELADLEVALGQERAVEALEFGVGMRQDGYNLFVLGPAGTGRHALVRRILEDRARGEAAQLGTEVHDLLEAWMVGNDLSFDGMNPVAVRKSHNLFLNAGVLGASANALNIRGVTMSNLQIDANFDSAAVALLEAGLKHTAKEVRKLVVLGPAGRDYNKLWQAKLSEDALADLVAIPGGDDAEVLLHMLDNDQPVGVRRKNFDRLREGFHNAMRKLSVRQRGMGQEHFSVTTTVPGAEMQLHGVGNISGLVFYTDSLGMMAVLDPGSRATLALP